MWFLKDVMKGLPIQQAQQRAPGSVKSQGLNEAKHSLKGEAQVQSTDGVPNDFLSLFSGLAGKDGDKVAAVKSNRKSDVKSDFKSAIKLDGKSNAKSEVKSETGETLKNLLGDKKEKIINEKSAESIEVIDPKLLSMEVAGKNLDHTQVAPTIAKTTSNLDQLLNKLKGTQDTSAMSETVELDNSKQNEEGIQSRELTKKGTLKNESKAQSPLEFLMKEVKGKGLGNSFENKLDLGKEQNIEQSVKKIVTAEDYLKNFETKDSNEKKNNANLVLLNGSSDLEKIANLNKNVNFNVKSYGQGQNLLNETMIRNTKDLSQKDNKKVKSDVLLGVDELQSKETKVGSQLADIKQDIVPIIPNKNAHNLEQNQTQTNANQKVLDLSNINTSNSNEIIKRISDYVEQNQTANKSSLDLNVKHESLGEFKIQVSKMPDSMNRGLNQIDMQITTSSKEGHDFFVKNEVSLMKNLNQAGINLSDLRIVSSMSESSAFGQSDYRQSSSFQQSPDGSSKSMTSESSSFAGNFSEGAERRKELWEEYQARFGA